MGEVIPIRDTRAEFDAALRDYLADVTEGGILTDYVIVAATTSMDDIGTGRTWYATLAPLTQPPHVTLGLLHYGIDNGQVDDD
jgi:hypothetical protein